MFTESEVVNEWIRQGMVKGKLEVQRECLLTVLTSRFPGAVTDDLMRRINEEDDMPLLDDWFRAALRASTFEQFLNVLKK